MPLPSPDAIVPLLEPPEPMTRLDHVFLLPGAVRLGLLAAPLAGIGGGGL